MVDLDQPLSTLGLGSLQAVLLRVRLEEQMRIVAPVEWLIADITLGEFLAQAEALRQQ